MSNPQEAFNTLLPTYHQIVTDSWKKRLASPEEVIADGHAQITVARQDAFKLNAAGVSDTLINEVEEALYGFSWTSSLLNTQIVADNGIKKEWAQTKALAYPLRKNLFKFGRFGATLNKVPEVLTEIEEIFEGNGDKDMIFDLLKLHQLYNAHPNLTEGLHTFDPTWIDQALELHNRLNQLLAQVQNPVDTTNDYATFEAQAYTHYYNKVYELRHWGEFVFEGEDRWSEYQSNFMQERRL